jgi:hypothetical protein
LPVARGVPADGRSLAAAGSASWWPGACGSCRPRRVGALLRLWGVWMPHPYNRIADKRLRAGVLVTQFQESCLWGRAAVSVAVEASAPVEQQRSLVWRIRIERDGFRVKIAKDKRSALQHQRTTWINVSRPITLANGILAEAGMHPNFNNNAVLLRARPRNERQLVVVVQPFHCPAYGHAVASIVGRHSHDLIRLVLQKRSHARDACLSRHSEAVARTWVVDRSEELNERVVTHHLCSRRGLRQNN